MENEKLDFTDDLLMQNRLLIVSNIMIVACIVVLLVFSAVAGKSINAVDGDDVSNEIVKDDRIVIVDESMGTGFMSSETKELRFDCTSFSVAGIDEVHKIYRIEERFYPDTSEQGFVEIHITDSFDEAVGALWEVWL